MRKYLRVVSPRVFRTSKSHTIWHIVILGLFLRVSLVAAGYAHSPSIEIFLNPDTDTYVVPAQSLLAAHRFYSNGHPEIIRTPGYPLLLTAGLLVHHLTSTTIVIQILLSCATIYLVYLSSMLIFANESTALAAAALYAIEPLSILYCSQILTETLFTTLSTLWLYCFLRYLRFHRISQLMFSAVIVAASVYVRPVGYFLPVFLGLGLIAVAIAAPWRRLSTQLCQALLFVVVAVGLLLLWQVRNEKEADYSGFAGISAVNMYFYLAASVLAVQHHNPFFKEQRELGYLNDRVYFTRHPDQGSWPLGARLVFIDAAAHQILAQNKTTYFWIHLSGVIRALFDSGATTFLIFFGFYKRGSGLLGSFNDGGMLWNVYMLFRLKPLVFWTNALLFPLELVYLLGTVVTICSRRIFNPLVAATLLVAAYYLMIAGGPAAVGRFKHPAMPALSILAGFGIIAARSWLHDRSPRLLWFLGKSPAVNYHPRDAFSMLTQTR